ncbi:hypothetical protein F5J12DRAFT_786016 [Pisolithus orientalis]|uniref:uncharacterized protein n=1 Tax=Pisolithus orientalis TaxID=936130 RepID=UPI0022252779|nr:uncharacterized protein F5J12DRAFT_786016 [Pisolithus orientalis]KAI5993140.1 hypothetical protein F5J12DRAFT_786016 [Pisolithus orientalis]
MYLIGRDRYEWMTKRMNVASICPYELSLHNHPGNGRWGAFDAHLLVKCDDHWIMSPNTDYVPQPFIFDGETITPLHDGWFSHIDCFQWPQLFAEHYTWSPCVPWKVAYGDNPTWKWLWWNITQSAEDFVLERGSAFKVGRIHADKWKSMETIAKEAPPLQRSSETQFVAGVMLQLPFTFQDTVILVAFCQCLLLDIFGMLEYLDTDLDPAMGTFVDSFDCWIRAFMTDPNICQCLFEICVPVWMVWKPDHVPPDMQVLKTVEITCPHDIVTDPEVFEVGQMLKWHSAWYHPAIGLEQFAAPWLEPLRTSSGVASTPTSMGPTASNAASSSSASSSTGAVRMGRAQQCNQPYPPVGLRGAKQLVVLNPELWEDLHDPAIPPTMSAWHAALKDMNKDAKRPKSVCEGQVLQLPAEVPEELASLLSSPKLISLQHDIPSHMMKSKILWDLYEHNLQFELVALDHAMMPSLWSNQDSEWLDHVWQIFPGDLELTMCAEPFPQQNQGLGLSDFQSKWEYVEKLWVLLAVWPGCPSDLAEPIMPLASSSHVWAMEKKLAIFYVQSFFDTFGCPSLLPHLIPTALRGYGSNSQ